MMNKLLITALAAFSFTAVTAGASTYRLINTDETQCAQTVTYDLTISADNALSLPAIDQNIDTCVARLKFGHIHTKKGVKYSKNEDTDTTITHQCKEWATGGDGYSGAMLWHAVSTEEKNFSFDLRMMTIKYTYRGWDFLHTDCSSTNFYKKHNRNYSCQYQKAD